MLQTVLTNVLVVYYDGLHYLAYLPWETHYFVTPESSATFLPPLVHMF